MSYGETSQGSLEVGSLVASSSQAVLLPLCRATVTGPRRRKWMVRRGRRSGMKGERGVWVAKLEVESNIDLATRGGEVQR